MIDLTTGLPELPEGHWWEIKSDKQISKIIGDFIQYDYGYSVNIMKMYTETTELRKKHWWSVRKTYEPITPYQREMNVEKTFVLKHDVFSAFDSTDLSATITPEGVLKAAQRCKDTYDRRIGSYNLVGKYPPKKLVTKKDDNA